MMRLVLTKLALVLLLTGFLFGTAIQRASGETAGSRYCIVEIPVSEDIVPGRYGFSMFSRLVTVPGFEHPFIDLGASVIATVDDGRLVPFSMRPLDQSNKVMPKFVKLEDGTILAYSQIDANIYTLSPNTGKFNLLDLPGMSEIRSAAAYATLEDFANHEVPSHGAPRLYGFIGQRLERLVHITSDSLQPVDLPKNWRPGGFPPAYLPEIGFFVEAQGALMFRRDEQARWMEISRYANIQGIMAIRPIESLHGHLSNDGIFFLLLADRVLIGHISDVDRAPNIVYQASGRQILHEPTGQVLLFPDKPFGSVWAKNSPELTRMEPFLHELQHDKPVIPAGDRLRQQYVSSVPFHRWIYHPESGKTLIAHRLGIATYDGEVIVDLKAFSELSQYSNALLRVGTKTILHAIGRGFFELTDDLQPREIILPEDGGSISLKYTPTLDRYIIHSSTWNSVYISNDLVGFEPIAGEIDKIVGYVGDLPNGQGTMLVSRNAAYTVQLCQDQR